MSRHENEAEVRALIENWAQAARAQDLDEVVSHHSDDIVMFDVPMPVQSRGAEEYRKTWELFFENSPGGPGSFELDELQITAGDTVAYAHAILKVADSTGRLTVGLRKEGGQWLVAHEHHSYPLEIETSAPLMAEAPAGA